MSDKSSKEDVVIISRCFLVMESIRGRDAREVDRGKDFGTKTLFVYLSPVGLAFSYG